jgi:predicted DNA-binding transcriptional regulator AlpA
VSRALSEIRPLPRRGLSRDEAAMYIGISVAKFDEMVADGRMPAPVRIDARKVWDIRSLDLDALPRENPTNSWNGNNPWDQAVAELQRG